MLAVGDSTRLEMIFDTGNYKGLVIKSPSILTNAGPQKFTPIIRTTIYSDPDSTFPAKILPSVVNFPDSGKATKLEFSIINVSKNDLKPALVSFPQKFVSISLPQVIPASDSASGTVTLTDHGQKENFTKSVTIQFDDPSGTRYTIPVSHGAVETPKPGGN